MPILSRREVLAVTGAHFIPWARGCLRPVMGWRAPGDEVVYFEKQVGDAYPVLEPAPRTEVQRKAAESRDKERARRGVDCYAPFLRGPGGRKFRRLLRRSRQSTRVD